MQNKTSKKNELYLEELVKSVNDDFIKRRQERQNFERQWKLNINYVAGNQYAEVLPNGEIAEEEKYYGWQSRSVFNHIAPIIDTRLAKLSRVRPSMSVRAASSEDCDLRAAEISSDILAATAQRISLDKVISRATEWSEVCGTAFYKVTWNADAGKRLGESDGKEVFEGDVEVSVIPPFEIFPDNLFAGDISELQSIIHARAVPVSKINELYNLSLKGEDIDVFSLNSSQLSANGGYRAKKVSSDLHEHVLVIERYERPSREFPNGRYVSVAGNALLECSELPYLNSVSGERDFPFIRQVSTSQVGGFFGVSLVERLIPVQRAYNAVKNRKYEFMNRISMGVLNVEDGSVDTDELIDEGLSPGKVIVYRQGSRPPQMMASNSVPIDFTYEEERLNGEFVSLSGTSEMSRTSDVSSTTLSGAAIELLIEQDETRLSISAESVRGAIKEVGKHVLRLFRQFATGTRIMRSAGDGKKVKLFYFKATDLSSDDIVFDTENEVTKTPAQKKTAVLEMLSNGLLTDDNGTISARTKSRILDILGYGSLANAQDLTALHRNKAERENIELEEKEIAPNEYDEHSIHQEEHLRKLLSLDGDDKYLGYKQRLENHLNEHKKLTYKANIKNISAELGDKE